MFITNTVRLGDAFASPVFLAAVTALTMTGAAQAQTKSWHHRDLTAATGATVLEHELGGSAVGPGGTGPRLYYSDYPA